MIGREADTEVRLCDRSELFELVVVERPRGSLISAFSCNSVKWTSSNAKTRRAVRRGDVKESSTNSELSLGLIKSFNCWPSLGPVCLVLGSFDVRGVSSSDIVSEGRLPGKMLEGRRSTGVVDESRRSVNDRIDAEDGRSVKDRAEAFDLDRVCLSGGLVTVSEASSNVSYIPR